MGGEEVKTGKIGWEKKNKMVIYREFLFKNLEIKEHFNYSIIILFKPWDMEWWSDWDRGLYENHELVSDQNFER